MYRKDSEFWESLPNANVLKVNDEDSKENVEEEEDGVMSFLFSSMYATILEDTIIQLRVLAECNSELRLRKTMINLNQLLADKYEVEQPVITDELEAIDVQKLGCNDYKLNKLEADRKLLNEVLKATYKDLCCNRVFQSLSSQVKKTVDLDEYRSCLIEEENKNKLLRRDLNRQLRQQRNHNKSVAYEYGNIIDSLKKEVEDAGIMAATQNRYVTKWQRARTEQHHQTIQDKESPSINSIEYYKQSAEHEQRVHSEVELLETLDKIETWMEKYDTDIEAIDLKIEIKKNELHDTQARREDLEITIAEHDKKMKEWIHFKDEREKARLYRVKMNNAAVTVQAWWRGLLVRMELGPYKVVRRRAPAALGGKKK